MADQAPEVKVKLTAEDTGVAAAIKALGSQLQDLKKQGSDANAVLGQLSSAFETIISAAAVAKVVEFGEEVFNASVNVERMSQKTGLSAGMLSTFAKAAEESGVSTEQMNNSLGRLATNITQFQQGSTKAAAAFKALNITQSDFKGLSPDQQVKLVTDRLGSMSNGLQKAAIAQQLMGRGGQALIPVLNALAGEGFDEVTAAAQRSGQFLTDEMASDAATAAAAFAELEGAGKGIATQFEAGLIPALTDVAFALTDSVEGDGIGAFKKLGEQAGMVVKGIVLGFQTLGDIIGAIFLSVYDVVHDAFAQILNGVETLAAATENATRGHFAAAGQALQDGMKKGIDQTKKDVDDLKSRWTTATDLMKQQAAALFPSEDKKAKLRPKPTGPESSGEPDDEKANKARLSLIEAQLQNELALSKAKNAQEEAENQIAYDEGLEGLQQYFEKRKQLLQSESDEQISVLSRQRAEIAKAPTDGTDAGETAKKQKLQKIDTDIAVAKIAATTKQKQLDQQQFSAEEAHQKTVLEYQAQILTAQGKTYEAAVANIQAEEAQVRRSLTQAGLTPDQVNAMVAQIQNLKLATASFDEQKKQGEQSLNSLADERSEIDLKVQTGQLSQIQGEIQLANAERARLPQLQQIAAAMKAAAITPEQRQEAEAYDLQVKKLAADANFMGQEFGKFKNNIEQSGISTLSTFLGSTIDQVHGVGDAFRQLGSTAISTLQQIAAQLIAEIAIHKLIEAVTHQGQAGGEQVANAAAAGVAQAAPLIAASTIMATSGTTIIAAGTALGVSAAALQVAASTLLLANSIKGGVGFADGGFVSGPGTGTSDSIPARLSAGEFVMNARSVQAIGVNTLAMMNRGVHLPSMSGLSIPRFAEGGLVQGRQRSDAMDLRLGIGLDEGIVMKHLSSKAAGRIILQHLGNNPKAATKALQRGQ